MKLLAKTWPILILAGLLLIFFIPALTGGTFIASGLFFNDLMLFNYPLKDWYQQMLHSGQLPFWTNLVGNGYPVLAEGQIGPFYPPHLLLFYLFPTLLAFNLNVFLHFFLAGAFTYLLCRDTFKLQRWASLLAGLTYALNGFALVHLTQINIVMVNAYLPLNFWLIHRILKNKRVFDGLLLALALALQFHIGHAEMFYYNLLLMGAFILGLIIFANIKINYGKTLAILALAGILLTGMSVVQIWPTLELTQLSNRSEGVSYEVASSTLWPLKMLTLFINPRAYDIYRPEMPDQMMNLSTAVVFALYSYIGLLPLALAFLAVIKSIRKPYVLLFTVLTVLAFLWGIGKSTQLFTLLWETIPGMKFFRYPVKILFFIEFTLAILAGFGLNTLLQKVDSWFSKSSAQPPGMPLTKKIKMLATPGVNMVSVLALVIILVTFVDLYINNCRYIQPTINGKDWFSPPESAQFLEPKLNQEFFRVYSHGSNNLDYHLARDVDMQKQFKNLMFIDFNMIYDVPTNREWFVLLVDRHTQLNQVNAQLNFEDASVSMPEEMKQSLSLQRVKYVLSDLPVEDPDFTLVKEIPFTQTVDHYAYVVTPQGIKTTTVPATATWIYENAQVYPHLTVVNKFRTVESGEQALAEVLKPDFDPREEVVLEKAPELETSLGQVKQARMVDYQHQQLAVEVETDQPAFLVLADSYYPGWQAWLDGQPTEIYQANYAFRAVLVPAGQHQVSMKFTPTHFYPLAMVSAASAAITLLGLAATGAWLKLKPPANRQLPRKRKLQS